MALLAQSFRATLPQTTINPSTSSTPEIKYTIQSWSGCLVQKCSKGDRIRSEVKGKTVSSVFNYNVVGHIARNCLLRPKASTEFADYFKDKMLLMQHKPNENADESNPQAGPSNASILSEVHTLENAIDHSVSNQDKPEIHNKVQPSKVIDTSSVHMGNNNVIPYEQYLSVNDISDVPSYASFALNSVYVSPVNDAFVYNQKTKTALGAQNPFYLKHAKKTQPALYDGDELLKPHYVPVIISTSEEELVLAEATRNKLHVKMNDSIYLAKRKAEELKANATPLPVLPPATVYPPNTPAHLVPRTLPTTSQVNIGLYVITQLFWDFEKTCKKRITPTGITEGERVTEVRAMKAVFENLEVEVDQNETDLRSGEIERKNLLITNENLVAECFAQKRIADLESENFNLRNKIQNDDHDSMIKHFSDFKLNSST
ncbi:hypothetical protein Tco_0002177 [Tanacetum coccineum]